MGPSTTGLCPYWKAGHLAPLTFASSQASSLFSFCEFIVLGCHLFISQLLIGPHLGTCSGPHVCLIKGSGHYLIGVSGAPAWKQLEKTGKLKQELSKLNLSFCDHGGITCSCGYPLPNFPQWQHLEKTIYNQTYRLWPSLTTTISGCLLSPLSFHFACSRVVRRGFTCTSWEAERCLIVVSFSISLS